MEFTALGISQDHRLGALFPKKGSRDENHVVSLLRARLDPVGDSEELVAQDGTVYT